MTARNQHYVWRYHLTAWQHDDGLVNCLLRGKLLRTNPRNILAQRDFYKLTSITRGDIAFFRAWLDRLESREMAELHQHTFETMVLGTTMNDIIQRSSDVPDDAKLLAQSAVIEAHERIHGMIEKKVLPTIRQLRNGCIDGLSTDETTIGFYRFVGHQYCRTKSVRDAISDVLAQPNPFGDFSRLAHILCLCIAENIAVWLFAARSDIDVCMLENDHDIEFITGDQTIVNLLGGDGLRPPGELLLYYPLSPRRAIVLARKRHELRGRHVSRSTVEMLNDFIRWKSRTCLVATSRDVLQGFLDRPRERRPSGGQVLSELR